MVYLSNSKKDSKGRLSVSPSHNGYYRVYRVPGFLSSRPNWLPPALSPAKECVAPPFGPGRGAPTRWGERGGGANSDNGTDTLVPYSRYSIIPLRAKMSYSSPRTPSFCCLWGWRGRGEGGKRWEGWMKEVKTLLWIATNSIEILKMCLKRSKILKYIYETVHGGNFFQSFLKKL